jgi:hypothetical protein
MNSNHRAPAVPEQRGSWTKLGEGALLLAVAGGAAVGASQSSQTGPILAFAGALIVVVITAITTDRRQARQMNADETAQTATLDAERERHSESLKAEGDRLALQLRHDRALLDVQHLREQLDRCAAAFEKSRTDVTSLIVTLKNPHPERLPDQVKWMRESLTSYTAVSIELRRLQLRLPDKHPVCVAYADVETQVYRRLFATKSFPDHDQLTDEQNDEDSDRGVDGLTAFGRFAAAARDAVGVAEAQAAQTAA